MPVWQFDLEEAEDLNLALTVDTGLQRMGFQFTAGYISDRYDRPLAPGIDKDQILVPNVNAPSVALRDTSSASFTERQAQRGAEAAMRAEMEQYDQVFDQLKADTIDIYKRRVREIAATAVPPRE
jgi:alanine racemase